MSKTAINETKKKLETVSNDMVAIMSCLEILEHSLYFASERKDKDITKPCAAVEEVILGMVDDCQDAIMESCVALEEFE